MSKHWEDVKEGYVIRIEDGRYVWEILANGNPENPVLYFTGYLWEAKAWKTIKAALKAKNRVPSAFGKCEVCHFTYDEEEAARILIAQTAD